jgi:c-di-GMP-binding flagellar brake protein YcgR
MSTLTFANQRTSIRYNLNLPLQITNLSTNKTYDTQTLNISCGGLAFVLQEELDTMEDIALVLDGVVHLTGKIVWTKHDIKKKSKDVFHGVRFYTYEDDTKTLLQQLGIQ